MTDQILQHYDKKGDCTVKSGCQVVLKINFLVFQDAQTRKQINGQSFGLCIYQKKNYSFGEQQKIFSEQLRVCGEGKYYHNRVAKFVGAV